MAQPFPSDNPYLARGFEPLRSECDCADLIVEGASPRGLGAARSIESGQTRNTRLAGPTTRCSPTG